MSSSERLIIALGAFAGGLAIGLLFAPDSGDRTRRAARVQAARSSRWLGERLESARQGIVEAGDEAASQLKRSAAQAAEKYIPGLLGDDDAWQDVYTSTAKDIEDEKS